MRGSRRDTRAHDEADLRALRLRDKGMGPSATARHVNDGRGSRGISLMLARIDADEALPCRCKDCLIARGPND